MSTWLPTSKKECERLGWKQLDVIIFSGDAYIDHSSFGTAVIGRVLESLGLRVAIVPQPNWQDDLRDFTKLGAPTMFFGVTAGCMDSMVNRYTANKRFRSEDAYTPNGRHDQRPDYPSIVYTNILKKLYPDVPVVLGGIEASMRRLTHYDYWQDKLLPSILIDSRADYLVYGMGEQPITAIANTIKEFGKKSKAHIQQLPQVCFVCNKEDIPNRIKEKDIILHPHSECITDKLKQILNFKLIETESNKISTNRIIQETNGLYVVINPPCRTMTQKELDAVYDLPFTRLPHPRYKGKRIPAYDMIRHSVTIHRGCFGGCSFCTISAHQGKFVISRSQKSVISEVESITKMEDFKGYISDLGGPSANMYNMTGKDKIICTKCERPSCIYPKICKNLNTNHKSITELYSAADSVPGVKKTFINSGIRYDLLMDINGNITSKSAKEYTKELITKHVSGRLKVAPEHTSQKVLTHMRKPSFNKFKKFKQVFDRLNNENNLNQQLIPYFISSHPGCSEEDMAELAVITKNMNFHLEQIQDFTPTPMTLSTEIFYSGIDPFTMKSVYSARTQNEKLSQRQFFFWYDPLQRKEIIAKLRRLKRFDLVSQLFNRS
ncbi:MAG TPA: YgiQ family radical SAM protein [Bacteroidaceae bacterium]|nr:YgiQ family radical SAM protein [Bacteroidaceae bacterium]